MNWPQTSRLVAIVFLLIVAGGLALRLIGIGSGLPHVVGVDEGFEIHRALKFGRGEVDLERTGKGGFFYLLFLEYAVYCAWLWLTGGIDSLEEFGLRFVVDPTPFWLIGRVTHALIAGGVIVWTFFLGKRMYGPLEGAVGAAVVAFSTLHVSHAHHIGVDLPMTLMVLLTMDLAHRWSDPQQPCRPILAGLSFGAAVMTKLPAMVLLFPLAIANWIRNREAPLWRRLAGAKITLAYGIAAITFVVGNPGVVLRSEQFFDQIANIAFGERREATGTQVGAADGVLSTGDDLRPQFQEFLRAGKRANLWLFYLKVLRSDIGILALILALLGLVYTLVRKEIAGILIASLVVPLYVVIAGAGTSHLYYPRYAIPLIPFLGILAARTLSAVASGLPLSARIRAAAGLVVGAALVLPSAVDSAQWSLRHTREDTRLLARRWIHEHVPAGSGVFLMGNPAVKTAPNIFVPLKDVDADLRELTEEARAESPAKAFYLELRSRTGTDVTYDLVAIQHYQRVQPLSEYQEGGVCYFVLGPEDFSRAGVSDDSKHPPEVLDSRVALYEALRSSDVADLIFRIGTEEGTLQGPEVEIYRLRSCSPEGDHRARIAL